MPKTLQKKETTKKKAITNKKEKPKPPKEKNVSREKTPELKSMGVYDTYLDWEDVDIDLAKMKRISPEFIWRIQEAKGPKNKTVYQLWYYAEVKPFAEEPAATREKPESTKEKPAAVKKTATAPPQKVEPTPAEEQYSRKEIAELRIVDKNSNLQKMS